VLNTGANTFSFRVIAAGDGNTANDLVNGNATFTPPATLPMPFAQDFTGTTFIPANMVLVNPNNNNTWVRRTNGHLTTPGSAFIDFYNFNQVGQVDEMRTGLLNIGTPTDSIIISFSLAHRNFPGFNDRFQVRISSNCGATFTTGTNPVFDRSGAALATAGSSTANYTTPAASDWRRFRLAVYTGPGSPFASGGNIIVSFHATNGYGNNIHVDDINVEKKVGRDMLVSLINTPGAQECNPTFMPSVVVRNNGAEAITSYRVGYILDNGSTVFATPNPITTPLAPGATTVINTFASAANAAPGNHSFRAFTADPVSVSGSGDQAPGNDTASRNFLTRTLFASAFEDFEGTAFPKPEWVLANPNNNFTWLRAAPGRAGSLRRMFIDNFNNNNPGQTDDLISAPVYCLNADSVRYSFDVAHRPFPGFNDRLQVLRSNDCGNTFVATGYDKTGTQLATGPSLNGAYTSVADNEWRRESVTVSGAALAPGSMIFALRNVNAFGNHIHAENINVEVFYKRNLGLLDIVRPVNECTQNVGPSVRVTNAGTETLTAFSIGYIIDANTPQIANFTGQSLAPGQSTIVSLPVSNGIALGPHNIVVYNVAPNVTSSTGSGDLFPLNDSLRTAFNVLGTQAAPLVEGFEGVVPPAKWAISNPDLNLTWTKQNSGNNSSNSASMQNFSYGNALTTSQTDHLITPVVTYSGVDSVYLAFDVAAATRRYPGSTQIALDTLEVKVTKDCGNTFTTVWKKWGEDLQTINDPNYSNVLAFNPGRFDWKTVKMNITGVAGTTANNLYVIFSNGSNNDNNVYVDNVNLSTLTLPARLKSQGYLLYPSPFTGAFNVQHFLPPTDLRYIDVYNARGQLVYKKQYGTGGANSTERIDLSNLAAGVYTVKLGYTNKQVVERIVKTNN
ncbi:MAG: T9SS type A sorting domain-containing protein, partial [Dinghuibacter sp.]|nr:T9SS type A sorting domain-containing protein [Dinghuibacter sp.]